MTCGKLDHPPGTPAHDHEVSAGDHAAADAKAAPARPGALSVLVRKHKQVLFPYAWIPATDAYATVVHFLAPGTMDPVLTVLCGGALTGLIAEIRNFQRKRRTAVRATARKAVAAATAWSLVAAPVTPLGWHGIMQWTLLTGGLAWAGVHVHRNRRVTATSAAPEQPALPPPPDPRLTAFTTRFCEGTHAPLRNSEVRNFTELTQGFSLEVFFPGHTAHTIRDVTNLSPLIAKLYDTSADGVSVGYVPDHRSEARALVVVHDARPEPGTTLASSRWDGESTYNPATGMIELGNYIDDKPVHYQLHAPRSGAYMGMAAGVPGAGKTGTISIIGAETGLMKLCGRCGGARACEQCDMQRAGLVWMGDAQAQSLGVWKGRADLTGWGVEGCLELMQLGATVADARSEALGSMKWTDHLGRENDSLGFFEPSPGFPLILLVIDEWPLMTGKSADPRIAAIVTELAAEAVTTWRKLGIHLLLGTQVLDMSQTGGRREIREMIKFFNMIAHRCDQVSSQMGDIRGDPTKLPRNEPGSGYIGGPDDRPDVRWRTKHCPDFVRPGDDGTDIRHISEVISRTPIAVDSSVTRAMGLFGLQHQDVITEWKGRSTSPAQVQPATIIPAQIPQGPGIGGLPTRDEAEAVRAALEASPAADVYRLMETTGLSLLAVGRSLDMLTANGDAIPDGAGQYTAA